MYAIQATYRGTSRRRADYVRQVADALGHAGGVHEARVLGAEDALVLAGDSDSATGVVLNLLQAGDFAVGIAAVTGDELDAADAYESTSGEGSDGDKPGDEDEGAAQAGSQDDQLTAQLAAAAARAAEGLRRAGQIHSRVELPGPGGVQYPGHGMEVASDITAAFTLLAHMLARRTAEGREATALMRQGHLQSEAAEMVGISKQAMSQRLAAAGWQAEQAGWQLAVHMLARTESLQSDDAFR